MMVQPETLTIRSYPDPVLRQKAKPVAEITDEVRAVAARMIELMREARGVGLAAPQVGLGWRMFVTNSGAPDEPDRVYINPRLSDPDGPLESREEGCLSMPNILGDVRRPVAITITALDLDGNEFTMRNDDLLARVWQHENDHLDGKLIIDRFSQMSKLANRKYLKELERAADA